MLIPAVIACFWAARAATAAQKKKAVIEAEAKAVITKAVIERACRIEDRMRRIERAVIERRAELDAEVDAEEEAARLKREGGGGGGGGGGSPEGQGGVSGFIGTA